MEISVSLPLDSDGFIRRECPRCEGQFKWHNGPANEEAESQAAPTAYHCPFCGQPADDGSWWTKEQLDYINGFAQPAALRYAQEKMASALRGNKFVKFNRSRSSGIPDVPAALSEPDDMRILTSPCHAYEPIKVPEGLSGPFHCLVCGTAFAV